MSNGSRPLRPIWLCTALLLPLLSASAFAADQQGSGRITLSGTVVETCSVSVTDMGASLDLVGGETDKPVGMVVENCNARGGYTIAISSAGKGELASTAPGTTPIAFTVGYDGQAGRPSQALLVQRDGARFDKAVPLTVSVPGADNRVAGSYSDTLTVTIAAK